MIIDIIIKMKKVKRITRDRMPMILKRPDGKLYRFATVDGEAHPKDHSWRVHYNEIQPEEILEIQA